MADRMLQHCKVVVNLCVWTIEIERTLFSEVRILGDATFTLKPNDHQHGERGISRCVRCARITSAVPQKGLWPQWQTVYKKGIIVCTLLLIYATCFIVKNPCSMIRPSSFSCTPFSKFLTVSAPEWYPLYVDSNGYPVPQLVTPSIWYDFHDTKPQKNALKWRRRKKKKKETWKGPGGFSILKEHVAVDRSRCVFEKRLKLSVMKYIWLERYLKSRI